MVMMKIAERTRDQIMVIYELETNRPFTLSHKRFSLSRREYIIDFIHYRNQSNSSARISRTIHTMRDGSGNFRSISQDEVSDDVLVGHLYSKGYKISDRKQLARLHEPDEYETELTVVSDIWAYFDIASNRVIDIMPMIFEVLFARGSGRELHKVLTSELKLVGDQGPENCARYAQDAENTHWKRVKLTDHKNILLQALQILRAY